jgi:hypothetical protein
MVSITYHKVGSFSDLSLEHKIFSHGRIFVHNRYKSLEQDR